MTSIRAALITAALTAGAFAAVTFAGSTAATASTLAHDGLRATTPNSTTVFNGKRATIRVRVGVAGGVKRQIATKRISAYRGRKRIARGSSVRLPAGKYKLSTTVRYRTFEDVKVPHTTRTFHNGSTARNSTCTVTQIDSTVNSDNDPSFGDIAQARCTNSEFPRQAAVITGPLSDVDCTYGGSYYYCMVGETYDSNVPTFTSYTSSKTTFTSVRKFGRYRTYSFPKRAYTVKNGGHRRVFGDNESLTTRYFKIPSGSRWRATYSYDCGDFNGNWIVDLHRKGTSILDDKNLDNVIRNYDYGTYRFSRGGTYRFSIITECDWTMTIRWR